MSRRDELECKVYVGDLPKDASERELERAFNYYGPLKKVWVAKSPPGTKLHYNSYILICALSL